MTAPGSGTPAPPPTPTAPAQDLSAAGDAARDRLEQAFPGSAPTSTAGPPEGTTPPPSEAGAGAPAAAPADAPFDIFADGAIEGLNFDNLQYRDGKKIETELRRARETFKPLNDALAGLDEDARGQLLSSLPTLGPDLAAIGSVAGQLHPDDRQFFRDAMALMATDPLRASEMLAGGAEVLRQSFAIPGQQPQGQEPPLPAGQQPMPDWAQPDGQTPDPMDAPLSRADFEAMMQERDYANLVANEEQSIISQARELGYDPESDDPIASARFTTLINLAGRPEVGGELSRAHELMQQMDQGAIDRFVEGKAADAGRPAAPVLGAPPADQRALATTEDARAAMANRLDAALGPDPRRRGED